MDYIKEAEGYLRSYSDLVESIDNIQNELWFLEENLTGAKAIDYSGMPGGGSTLPDDKLVNLLYKKQVQEKSLEATKNMVRHIDEIFIKIGEKDKAILKAFYVDGLRGYALEEKFNVSDRQVYNLKKSAIRRFAIQLFGIKAIGE